MKAPSEKRKRILALHARAIRFRANASRVEALRLEDEADELCAVYATIVMTTEKRMAQEAASRRRRRPTDH